MKDVLVSVYITTKDRPVLLERALNSICSQTYKNIEVLICNDGSESSYDNDYDSIIKEYENKFINLVYIKNSISKGACASRNYLIEQAKGYFVTGLDDDDYFHATRISKFLKHYDDNYGFICANSTHDEHQFSDIKGGTEIYFEDMKFLNRVGNQIFIRRDRMLASGCFDVNMPAWQDYDAWFRLLQIYKVALKLKARTMFVDVNPTRLRISTTSNAHAGYLKFIEKNKHLLTAEHLISLKYTDLINRKAEFSMINSDLLRHPRLWAKVFKNRSVYYYPGLYKFFRKFFK